MTLDENIIAQDQEYVAMKENHDPSDYQEMQVEDVRVYLNS
jgi:hypothetical protein